MKLGPEELKVVRAIEDEAIAACRDNRGRVDHVAASLYRRDALAELEAAGVTWAAGLRDAAELDGHRKVISRRLKARSVRIPAPSGAVTMPAVYSRRRQDGGQQMSFWLYLSLDDLGKLIAELQGKATTLATRAEAMRKGLDLARQHEVTTAAEGFAAAGIDVGDIAA